MRISLMNKICLNEYIVALFHFPIFFCCCTCREHDTLLEGVPKSNKSKKGGPVDDGVTTVDCTSLCRCFGYSRPWLRRVWFVRDVCGLVSSQVSVCM